VTQCVRWGVFDFREEGEIGSEPLTKRCNCKLQPNCQSWKRSWGGFARAIPPLRNYFSRWLSYTRKKVSCADCVNEARAGERSGEGAVSSCQLAEGHGGSLSSSVTDETQSEETNLLLTAVRDDDCSLLTPVSYLPRDVVRCVDMLGDGLFGEVTHAFPIFGHSSVVWRGASQYIAMVRVSNRIYFLAFALGLHAEPGSSLLISRSCLRLTDRPGISYLDNRLQCVTQFVKKRHRNRMAWF